ncbi:uncharacterized protein [Danio rerio]|uniref:Uncharacterized protein n=1 Tax=Danio rerio TaxID=7955 RepID=A0AC58I4G4_DANRE
MHPHHSGYGNSGPAVLYLIWSRGWDGDRLLEVHPGACFCSGHHNLWEVHRLSVFVKSFKDREQVSRVPGLTLGEAQQAWKNAAHPALQNRHKDLAWMVAHEILPVRAVMHSRGMAKTSICPRPGCSSPETVRHLLWECGAARDLWAATGPLYQRNLPAGGAQMSYHLAIHGVGRGATDMEKEDFTALWLTLNAIKDAIWVTRNLLVAKGVTVPLHRAKHIASSTLEGYRAPTLGRGGRGHTRRVPAATVPGRP